MKLNGFPSSRSKRGGWAWEEGGDYECVRVDLMKGEGQHPEYLSLNLAGKVPTLVNGDGVLTESAAIVTYIGERYPESVLVPTELADRAQYFRWCFFVIDELEQPLWTLGKHRCALPRIPAIDLTTLGEFSKAAKMLDEGLQDRDYSVGSHFTGTNILVGSRSIGLTLADPVGFGTSGSLCQADIGAPRLPACLQTRRRTDHAAKDGTMGEVKPVVSF